MKKILFIAIALFISITAIHAQNALTNASNKLDNASNTIDKASNFANKVGGLFKKKKKNADSASASQTKTLSGFQTSFNIKGISMSNLKKLNDNIKATKGVSNTKMKFSGSGTSTIYVAHSGSTQDLVDAVEKKSKDIFTDKNIQSLDDGKVELDVSE